MESLAIRSAVSLSTTSQKQGEERDVFVTLCS